MARAVKPARGSFFARLFGQHKAGRRRLEPQLLTRSAFSMAQHSNIATQWTTATDDPNRMLRGSLQVLRARSRDVARNTDYGRGFMLKLRTNVIGHKGIRLYVDGLAASGERDAEASKAVADRFAEWGKRGECTACGRLSWRDVEALAIRSIVRDGEFLALKLQGRAAGRFSFRLQLLDPDLLDETYNERLPDGRRVILGVEVDAALRPVAYHILSDRRNAHVPAASVTRRRVPADQVIHAFIADDVDQVRGVPHLNPTGKRLYQLDKYEESEVVAARIGASKAGYIETTDGGFGGHEAEGEGDGDGDAGRAEVEVENGMFPVLAPGQKIGTYNPDHPSTAFEPFVKQSLRGAAAGVGLSYVAFSGDLEGVNYSSIRQGALEDRSLWQDLQAFLSEHVLTPVFEAWLPSAVLAGELPEVQPTRVSAFNRPVWHARGWAWVDPLKEVNGQEKEVALGITSRRRIATERGRDWDEVQGELAEEEGGPRQYAPPSGDAGAPPPVQPPEEGDQ